MKSGCAGDLRPGKLGLSYKANKCSDAGAGDHGELTTNETSSIVGLIRPRLILLHVQVGYTAGTGG